MALELTNLLITGASGFIGTHLMTYFKEKNVTYVPFVGDLLDKKSIRIFFSEHQITQIVHLVGTFDGDFDAQMSLNFETTKNLLEVANEYGVKKIIFTSTGATYGEPLGEISYESDIQKPNTWYGLSKKLTEELVLYYQNNYGFTAIILRYSSVYGPGSKGVISSFQKNIGKIGKITIHGDGEQSRNFLHISDAVHAIYLASKYEKSDIFNITNPIKTSLNELVEVFQQRYTFEVEYIAHYENSVRDLLLSPNKARDILHFEAKQIDILID